MLYTSKCVLWIWIIAGCCSIQLGMIIPTDFHIFQGGWYTTNQLNVVGSWGSKPAKVLVNQGFLMFNSLLVGGLQHLFLSMYWEFYHPNWRTHIFQRRRLKPPTSLLFIQKNHYFKPWYEFRSLRISHRHLSPPDHGTGVHTCLGDDRCPGFLKWRYPATQVPEIWLVFRSWFPSWEAMSRCRFHDFQAISHFDFPVGVSHQIDVIIQLLLS